MKASGSLFIQNHQLEGEGVVKLSCPKNEKLFDSSYPDSIILHYTAGASAESSANYLCRDDVKASAHILIGRDGTIYQMVPFNTIAWHAGKSNYGGRSGFNSYAIGIEMDNAGVLEKTEGGMFRSWFGKNYKEEEVIKAIHRNDTEYKYWHSYTDQQISHVDEVCRLLTDTYPVRQILGHEEIAPGRKLDPGPAFPLEEIRNHFFSQDYVFTKEKIQSGYQPTQLNISSQLINDVAKEGELGLDFDHYIAAFKQFLTGETTVAPLTIGIQGVWGSGKSTLMKGIKKALEKDKNSLAIWFNAWRYEKEENLWNAFLKALIVQSSKKFSFFTRIYYSFLLYRFNYWLLGVVFLLTLVGAFLPEAIDLFKNQTFKLVNTIVLYSSGVAVFVKKLIDFWNKPFGLNISKINNNLKSIKDDAAISTFEKNFIDFLKIYSRLNRSEQDPLYIFIDDLDRCPPDRIITMVNAINTLSQLKNCVFFVAFDRDYVASAISIHYEKIAERMHDDTTPLDFGYNFLDKIIQVSFKLPKINSKQFQQYVKSLLNVEIKINKTEAENFDPSFQDHDEQDNEGFTNDVNDSDIQVPFKPEEISNAEIEEFNNTAAVVLKLAVEKFGLDNQRKTIKFINLFKVMVYIAYYSGFLTRNQISAFQLGVFLLTNIYYPEELQYFLKRERNIKVSHDYTYNDYVGNAGFVRGTIADIINTNFSSSEEDTKRLKLLYQFIGEKLAMGEG